MKTEQEILQNYKKRIAKQNNHIKNTYDRVSATLPKGTKERIAAAGETANGLINKLVIEYLENIEKK